MRYTVKQFKAEYPDDDACLEAVFQARYGNLKACPKCGVIGATFHRVRGRQCYACAHCGGQLHPLTNAIFRKSSTSLWNWFYAIYLFSVAKNGVSAKELERQLGATYKTAWRMAKQIRLLMQQETGMLSGFVEADETYIGGRTQMTHNRNNKTPVVGVVEKKRHDKTDGRLKAIALSEKASDSNVMPFLIKNVEPMSVLHTDKSLIYRNAMKDGFLHQSIKHSYHHYVENCVHTNNIESFWGQLKRSTSGTYHHVSPKYLQTYVDEFVFRYNHRNAPVYPVLIQRVAKHD